MGHPNFMDVLNSIDQLMEEPASLFLLESLVLDNILKKFTALHELHYQEQLLGSLYNFVKLDNTRVPYQFKDVDLS